MTDKKKSNLRKGKKVAKRSDFDDKRNVDMIKNYRCVNKLKLLTSARKIHNYRLFNDICFIKYQNYMFC